MLRGLTRRRLLAGGGVAGASVISGAAGYLAAREVSGSDDRGSGAANASTDRAHGALFERDPHNVNLTTFVLASHPRPVREAIERHRRRLDTDTEIYLSKAEVSLEEAARSALGGYLGADPEEIALTD